MTMTQELRQELANMVGPIQWDWLKPHIARDAVVFVDPQLDIIDVGIALTTDNVQSVQRWIGEQLITKPTGRAVKNLGEHWPQSSTTVPDCPTLCTGTRNSKSSRHQQWLPFLIHSNGKASAGKRSGNLGPARQFNPRTVFTATGLWLGLTAGSSLLRDCGGDLRDLP